MNRHLRGAINYNNMLKRRFEKYISSSNWEFYRKHRSYVVKLRRNSLWTYLNTSTCSRCNRKQRSLFDKEIHCGIVQMVKYRENLKVYIKEYWYKCQYGDENIWQKRANTKRIRNTYHTARFKLCTSNQINLGSDNVQGLYVYQQLKFIWIC